ncbi:MAG: alpha/beta fold hydrolase [Acetobacteraceae bacterium]
MTNAPGLAAGLAVRCDGPEGAPLIVFANSLGASMAMWDEVVGPLAVRFRCLRFDKPGHGDSAPDASITLESLADRVASLIAGSGAGRAHFVGLSIGGMLAQLLLRRRPDLIASAVLIATAAHIPSPHAWEERARTVERDGPGAIVEAVLGRWFTPAFARARPDRVASVREAFLATDRASYAACCREIARFDLRGMRPGSLVPTLVVSASEDPATPPSLGAALADDLGADHVLLRGAAHLVAVERAGDIAALVGWVAAAHTAAA